MARVERSPAIWVYLALLVLAAAGGCSGPRRPNASGIPNFLRVVVGPSAKDVDPPDLEIWRSDDSGKPSDEVFWILIDNNKKLDTTRKLFIEFEKSDAFPDNVLNGNSHRYRVRCSGAFCQSGPIGKGASGKYKYWQIVVDPDGTEHPEDGRIIIKP